MASQALRSTRNTTDGPTAKRAKTDSLAITDVNKPYQSEHADITLVSSDGLPFKVHSYHLKSSSPVFRAMLDIGDSASSLSSSSVSSSEVELLDEEIENSAVLRIFLDIVHGVSLQEPDSLATQKVYESVVAFLRKYEAASAIEVVRLNLIAWARHGHFMHLDLFVLGCMLDDVELCKTAITSPGRQNWDSFNLDSNHLTAKRNVMDLSAAPLAYLRQIPDNYKWALMQASAVATKRYNVWAKADKIEESQLAEDRLAVAAKFGELMQQIRA
ncbi:hypothetical protein I317_02837 [Kwoniella heveanensis CBS 569]|nr:hypothetical protein I317_02837 [Kwoniella heveanensis CBS 569]